MIDSGASPAAGIIFSADGSGAATGCGAGVGALISRGVGSGAGAGRVLGAGVTAAGDGSGAGAAAVVADAAGFGTSGPAGTMTSVDGFASALDFATDTGMVGAAAWTSGWAGGALVSAAGRPLEGAVPDSDDVPAAGAAFGVAAFTAGAPAVPDGADVEVPAAAGLFVASGLFADGLAALAAVASCSGSESDFAFVLTLTGVLGSVGLVAID